VSKIGVNNSFVIRSLAGVGEQRETGGQIPESRGLGWRSIRRRVRTCGWLGLGLGRPEAAALLCSRGGDGSPAAWGRGFRAGEVQCRSRKVVEGSIWGERHRRGALHVQSSGGACAGRVGRLGRTRCPFIGGGEEEGELGLLSCEGMAGTGREGAWWCTRQSSPCAQGDGAAWH